MSMIDDIIEALIKSGDSDKVPLILRFGGGNCPLCGKTMSADFTRRQLYCSCCRAIIRQRDSLLFGIENRGK